MCVRVRVCVWARVCMCVCVCVCVYVVDGIVGVEVGAISKAVVLIINLFAPKHATLITCGNEPF